MANATGSVGPDADSPFFTLTMGTTIGAASRAVSMEWSVDRSMGPATCAAREPKGLTWQGREVDGVSGVPGGSTRRGLGPGKEEGRLTAAALLNRCSSPAEGTAT